MSCRLQKRVFLVRTYGITGSHRNTEIWQTQRAKSVHDARLRMKIGENVFTFGLTRIPSLVEAPCCDSARVYQVGAAPQKIFAKIVP